MIKTKFYVRSDVDDSNIRADFDDQVDAIAYASGFSPADKCYVVEATVDVDKESGKILRELESETIWTFEDLPTEDAFGVNDWPDVSIKDEEEMKLNTDFDVKDIHEELEAREDLVECQRCFDLFPKEECTKIEYGYLCPHCHSLVVKRAEFPSETVGDATFGLDFPEPCEFDDDCDKADKEPIAIEAPALAEHVQDRPAPIEDTTVLQGVDNAVVKCKKYTLAAHCEDEKPVDCKLEKPALEKPLAGEKVDIKLNEGFEDELVAFAASLPDDLHEDVLAEGPMDWLKDKFTGGKHGIKQEYDGSGPEKGYKILIKTSSGWKKEPEIFNGKTVIATFDEAEKTAKKLSTIVGKDIKKVAIITNTSAPQTLATYKDGKELTSNVKDINKQNKQNKKDGKAASELGWNEEAPKAGEPKADEPKAEEKPAEEPKAEEKPAEEAPTKETPAAKRDMSKQNEARAQYKKIEKALEILGVSKEVLRDGDKVTQKFKDLRKALFTESYPDMPFDSNVKEGDKIRIIHLEGEDNSYDGKEGTVEHIDSIGQLHGTWGELAIIPGVDDFEIITEESLKEELDINTYRVVLADYDSDDFDINVEFGLQDEEENDVADQEWLLKPGQTKGDLVVYLSYECAYTSIYVHDERPATADEIKTISGFDTVPGITDWENYGSIDESLKEAKKDEEEPTDPDQAKLDAHTMLNNLVADEIEAIDGYEAAKAELLDKHLEHKEEIIRTIDHIKDEEKEHIDELIQATRKIPFEKPAVEELEEDITAEKPEGVKEDKKVDESSVDPEAAKLEVHTMLNDLVADEIEAINGYDDAKAEIVDTPIEHKDSILDTIDHIKEEEQEHIDELIDATTEIPFDKEENHDFAAEEDALAEETHAKYAKPEGDRVTAYNNALKYAKKENKPFIYGYTQMGDGKFFALEQPIKISSSPAEAEEEFKNKYKRCSTVYTVYPNKEFISEELHKNEEALVAEWARQGVETGMIFDESDYDQFAKICKNEGIEPSEELFKHYFKCVDDLVGVKEESLEFTCDQDLADDRTPAQEKPTEFEEPVDGAEVRKHEKAIKEDISEDDAKIVDYVEYKHSYCHALEPKLKKINYYANVLKKPVNYIKAMVKGIIKDSPEVKWTDKEVWF